MYLINYNFLNIFIFIVLIIKERLVLFSYYRNIIGNTMIIITISSNALILSMDITKSDNNNNANNIIIILHIDYYTDNRISRNRTPIRCYNFMPRSTISLNAVNIKSE